ncbi:MAG: hypothetical protein KatS3mg050_2703 [Litorilinea sp.]|nr:MAG: hypothetical protein KatS3mg050_2703 [Litorilinea sp.]
MEIRRPILALLLVVGLVMPGWKVQARPQMVTDTPAASALEAEAEVDPSTLLLGLEGEPSEAELRAWLQANGLELTRRWPEFGLIAARPADEAVLASSAELYSAMEVRRAAVDQAPFIRFAEFNARIQAASRLLLNPPQEPPPNDPLLPQQWALERIGALSAWGISQGSPAITVALIDSGFDVTHPDLVNAPLWHNQAELAGVAGVDDDGNGFVDDFYGWDWVEQDNEPNDPYGHGTHVGGILAATANNGEGIAGLGRQLQILPLRVLDAQGRGYIDDLIDALYYAVRAGARIANMSLTLNTDPSALRVAVDNAYRQGLLLVAAAGNHSPGFPSPPVYWPAAYPQVMAVAATDANDQWASFSNQGMEVEVAAPGAGILSTYRNGGYGTLSGTSMATPHVSALAGLLWSLRPDLSRDQIRALIQETAEDVNGDTAPGRDASLGFGRINAHAALLAASADLGLQPLASSPQVVFKGEAVSFLVRVVTPDQGSGSLPVGGAVVYYGLGPAGEELPPQAVITGTLSNERGVAALQFQAPTTAGDYTLHLQVGQAAGQTPVYVQAEPVQVEFTVTPSTLQVGQTGSLTLRLLDDEGQPMAGEMPISLVTDLGAFGDGSTARDVVVHNGVYTDTFQAGTRAGQASIRAQIGHLRANVTVTIQPGPATEIQGPLDLPALFPPAESYSLPLTFRVTDSYGNPVGDGLPVQVFASTGSVTPTATLTISGTITTTVTIPAGQREPMVMWVVVPGTHLQKRVDLTFVVPTLWLPFIESRED